jgi:hypothetical protein
VAFAIPLLVLAAEAAAEAIVFVGSAVIAAAAINEVAQTVSKERDRAEPRTTTDCPPMRTPCPPCQPPVGTIGYDIHRTHGDWPCVADHVHWFLRQQNPNNCQCFWMRNYIRPTCLEPGEMPVIPPGAVPVQEGL